MSKYKMVHQCGKCKKAYSEYWYLVRVWDNDGICPKCGARGYFVRKIAKRTLRGWKFAKEDWRNND